MSPLPTNITPTTPSLGGADDHAGQHNAVNALVNTHDGILSGLVYNVKAYGATGDGVTDDYTAINSAITALSTTGGILFFPKGTYLVYATLLIPSNCTIKGAGRNASIIKQGFVASGVDTVGIINNSDTVNGNINITIRDIQLFTTATTGTVPSLTTSTCAIAFKGASDVVIDSVFSQNGTLQFQPLPAFVNTTNVHTTGKLNRIKISNTRVDSGAEAVYFQQGTDLEVTNCHFSGCFDSTLSINSSGERISISNTILDGKGLAWAALALIEVGNDGAGDTNGIRDLTITGNQLLNAANTGTRGIQLQKVNDVVFTGNEIRNINAQGIYIATGSTNISVTGNVVVGLTSANGHGVQLGNDGITSLANITITGNTLQGNAGNGIQVGGGAQTLTSVLISSNSINGNTGTGINLAANATNGQVLMNNIIGNGSATGGTGTGWSIIHPNGAYLGVGINNAASKLDLGGTTDSTQMINSVWRGDATNSKYGHIFQGSGAAAFTGDGALVQISLGNGSDSGKALQINHSGNNLNSSAFNINKYGTGVGAGIQVSNSGTGPAINLVNLSTGPALNVTQASTGYGATIAGNVGMGNTTPNSVLQVSGAIATAFTAKTAPYTLTATDSTVTVTGATTITLPTAVGITGRVYTIKKIDAGGTNVTIATTSAQTIDGVATALLQVQWASTQLQSDGANWIVI